MKKIKLIDKIVISFVGCAFIFGGCNNNISKNKADMNVGHFVNVFNHNIEYHCADKVTTLSADGEFTCQSFPITFYMDNVKLGEISSIHNDGYVFPQDIIVLEESQPIYSSDDSMKLATVYE